RPTNICDIELGGLRRDEWAHAYSAGLQSHAMGWRVPTAPWRWASDDSSRGDRVNGRGEAVRRVMHAGGERPRGAATGPRSPPLPALAVVGPMCVSACRISGRGER